MDGLISQGFQVLTSLFGAGFVLLFLILIYNIGRWRQKHDSDMQTIVSAIRAIISTIEDEGERRALELAFVFKNSPLMLNREILRTLVDKYGRPPAHVIEAIVRIVADVTLDEPYKIVAAIDAAFTTEQLERAYNVHGGGAIVAQKIFLQVVKEAREEGADRFLRDVHLID
jgi:hypothetical protein